MKRIVACFLSCAISFAAPRARADDAPPPQNSDDYRGRTPYTRADEVAAWIPRVLFSPLYFVTEYGLRLPVYEFLQWADRHNVIPYVNDVVLKPTKDVRWNPVVVVDVGVFYAGGAMFEFSNLGAKDHTLTLMAAGGGPDAWFFSARDDWKSGPAHVGLHGAAFSRADRSYYGLGPYSENAKVDFAQTRFEGFGYASVARGNHFQLQGSAGFRADHTGPSDDDGPSIESRFKTSGVPGFGQTMLAMSMLDLKLDTRENVDVSGGARLLANATYARDVTDSARTFVSTTVDAEVAAEVMKPDRVLALRGYFRDAIPLGTEPVPFLEQSMLGWRNHYGFFWGRFRDESALMLELRYRYPVAFFVDMTWIASVGNVFKRDLSDFDPKALTTSLGVGFRTRRTGRRPLELIVAVGSTRFDEAFGVQSVRFYLSTTEEL